MQQNIFLYLLSEVLLFETVKSAECEHCLMQPPTHYVYSFLTPFLFVLVILLTQCGHLLNMVTFIQSQG